MIFSDSQRRRLLPHQARSLTIFSDPYHLGLLCKSWALLAESRKQHFLLKLDLNLHSHKPPLSRQRLLRGENE
jgi:hypothetical protein